MKIYEQNFPWKHWIIDDFIPDRYVNHLQRFAKSIHNRKYESNHLIFGTGLNEDKLDHMCQKILQYTKDTMTEVVKQLDYTPPRDYPVTQNTAHIAFHPKEYYKEPHCDSELKIWSFVTFIGPETSHGTMLSSDKENTNLIKTPWKPGRCLLFAGENNTTWHSYESGNDWRATITSNICIYKENVDK